MASEGKKTRAEQLKAEGNALYVRNNFSAARLKYTEAIQLDGDNAIFYSNRAAAYIALKQYLDAARDAQKAVGVDPKNSEAWARFGKSAHELHLYELGVDAWKKALSTLPAADLSWQENQLKQHFQDGLKLADGDLATFKNRSMSDNKLFVLPDNQTSCPG